MSSAWLAIIFVVNLAFLGALVYLIVKILKQNGGNAFVVIRDPLTGNAARIKDGRQVVRAVSSSIGGFMANEGWHFSANTGLMPLPEDFRGGILYFRNDNPSLKFFVNKIIVGWTPNNSNANKNAKMIVEYDATAPTENAAEALGGNTNRGHSRTNHEAGRFAMMWNRQGGTGFQGANDGVGGIPYTIAPGQFIHEIEGNIILNHGRSLVFNVYAKETGTINIALTGWFAPEL